MLQYAKVTIGTDKKRQQNCTLNLLHIVLKTISKLQIPEFFFSIILFINDTRMMPVAPRNVCLFMGTFYLYTLTLIKKLCGEC